MATTQIKANDESPPSIIDCLVSNNLVKVEVGPDRKVYHVHKEFLTYYSEYCRNLLRGPWQEAQEGVVRFTETEPVAFNLFVFWMYKERLPSTKRHGLTNEWFATLEIEVQKHHDTFATLEACIKGYKFADQYLCHEFRRTVHDYVVDEVMEYPGLSLVHDYYRLIILAFENIPANRPILQCIVDEHCKCQEYIVKPSSDSEKRALEMEKTLPHAFLRRVMRRYNELKDPKQAEIDRMDNGGRCYYEHEDEQERKECYELHMRFDEELECAFFVEE